MASQSNTQRRSSEQTPWSHVWQFFRLGVEHIWLGYDHVLFLLSLILIVDRFGQLVKIVTSFTVAHTVTLILSALKVVSLPRDMVEIAIAATIIYTALENFWIHPGDAASRRRWMLAFGFGLIHGFGFAAVLRELGLPSTGLIRCLLSFNVGVEFGQLVIVARNLSAGHTHASLATRPCRATRPFGNDRAMWFWMVVGSCAWLGRDAGIVLIDQVCRIALAKRVESRIEKMVIV